MNSRASFLIIVLVAIAIVAIYLVENAPPPASGMPSSFTINNRSYQITSYAYTTQQQEQGLMNATVTNSTFMLFAFGQEGIYPFWMKNTYYPLDMLWVSYNSTSHFGKVVYIAHAVPCSEYNSSQVSCRVYTPTAYANYVIEAKAGFANASNISVGTPIRFT